MAERRDPRIREGEELIAIQPLDSSMYGSRTFYPETALQLATRLTNDPNSGWEGVRIIVPAWDSTLKPIPNHGTVVGRRRTQTS
jgi:hypothetical protein